MSKAIYKPKGKAGEYAMYACNFYNGCSNECEYCYLKKGVLKGTMGGNKPTLKKCFKDEENAIGVFEKELNENLPELQKHGLFYSFSTDPMLPETSFLTFHTAMIANEKGVPVKILTKCAGNWVNELIEMVPQEWRSMLAYGFTLTGHDELEPNASTNKDRIEAIKKLHTAGFKTFASLEPIITTESTAKMMQSVDGYCDLFMIGIESGKTYSVWDLRSLILGSAFVKSKIYFKDSFLKACKMNREDLPTYCVNRDYNLFENE